MRISDWSSDVCSSDLGRLDRDAHIALLFDLAHPAKVGDQAREHGANLVLAAQGFQQIVPESLNRKAVEASHAFKPIHAVGRDRRHAVAADQTAGPPPANAIDQSGPQHPTNAGSGTRVSLSENLREPLILKK